MIKSIKAILAQDKEKFNTIDGTPCAVKVACTVWSGGKLGDNIKELPITIQLAAPSERQQ